MATTLEQAVEEFNLMHKKDYLSPVAKTAKLDILAYKILETDSGPIPDEESYETCHYELRVYQQKNFANSYIATRKSKHSETGFELQIMHLLFNGPERGPCVSFVKLGDCEAEGVEVIKGIPEKVSAKTAAELFKTGKYLLRVKRGKKYESPPVAVFSYGMGDE